VPPRIKALFLLAFALVRTLLRRAVGGGRDGLRSFRKNYAADGLAPVTLEERNKMADFGGCIACGICDRGESVRIARSQGAYAGVMEAVLAASRSMPDYAAATIAFSHVSDELLTEKERTCPTAVPMRQIAAFVRDKASGARVSIAAQSSPRALPRASS
jgi:hypothetical protein